MRFIRVAGVVFSAVLIRSITQAQDASQLGQEDTRLNQFYQQRVAQLHNDPAKLTALRADERGWIRQRDRYCGKDVDCLARETNVRADYLQNQVRQNDSAAKPGDPIPQQLQGKWIIRKVLPTGTISCWSDKRAKALLGTELEYKSDGFRWEKTSVRNLGVTASTIQADQFAEYNSGSGSHVNFVELGIKSPTVQQIAIDHPDVDIKGSGQMPGETVLIKSPDAMIFSVCNIYFEAQRASSR
jgi:hypothetical protein